MHLLKILLDRGLICLAVALLNKDVDLLSESDDFLILPFNLCSETCYVLGRFRSRLHFLVCVLISRFVDRREEDGVLLPGIDITTLP